MGVWPMPFAITEYTQALENDRAPYPNQCKNTFLDSAGRGLDIISP